MVFGLIQQLFYNIIYYFILLIVFGFTIIIAFLWAFQDKIVFMPNGVDFSFLSNNSNSTNSLRYPSSNPVGLKDPKEKGMTFEDVFAVTKDGIKIHMWFITQPSNIKPIVPTILYLQSQSGNIGLRLDLMRLFYQFPANILMLSYRGYGYSEGKPSETGLYLDVEEASKFLIKRTDIDKSKIFVYGSSLGTAFAVEAAFKHPELYSGLILENPFTNLFNVALFHFPILKFFFFSKYLFNYSMDNKQKMEYINLPLLILTSTEDTIVPSHNSSTLLEVSPAKVKNQICIKSDHNEIWLNETKKLLKSVYNFIHKENKS